MEAPIEPKDGTFTLQVLSHSVGSTETLSFSNLPITTTVDQLKTKIRERVSHSNADETQQRLIHRGRLLNRADETMVDLFGADTLKNFPTQSLHLSITPRLGERPSETPVPTPTIPLPTGQLPLPQEPAAALPSSYPNAFPRRSQEERAEEERQEQINHAHAISEAARAYAAQRLDIDSLHQANNHAVQASTHLLQNMQAHGAPLSIRETARTGLQIALENQYQAWQRAYLNSTQNERHILSQSYGNSGDGPLLHAIRMGIEYLEAEDRLASSQPGQDEPGQESEIVRRDRALQRYQQASHVANAAIGLPTGNNPRLSSPEQRAARQARHHRRAAAVAGNGEPLPALGHGPNVRPLAAGMLAALVVPHLWIVFKLAIFVYAFTRMNNSWSNIAMMCMVAFGIFLYNIGILERVWARLMDHVHRLLAVTEPQRVENGVVLAPGAAAAGTGSAAQPTASGNDGRRPAQTAGEVRRRVAEPTPEAYAQRLLDQRQQEAQIQAQANRSAWKETARMFERDVLLFFLSIVPGIAERHIGAFRAASRAREREQERAEREQEEATGNGREARDGEERQQEDALPAPGEGDVPGAEDRGAFGGAGRRIDDAQQGRPAAVEDEVFGGVD